MSNYDSDNQNKTMDDILKSMEAEAPPSSNPTADYVKQNAHVIEALVAKGWSLRAIFERLAEGSDADRSASTLAAYYKSTRPETKKKSRKKGELEVLGMAEQELDSIQKRIVEEHGNSRRIFFLTLIAIVFMPVFFFSDDRIALFYQGNWAPLLVLFAVMNFMSSRHCFRCYWAMREKKHSFLAAILDDPRRYYPVKEVTFTEQELGKSEVPNHE